MSSLDYDGVDRQTYEKPNCSSSKPHDQHFHSPIGGLTLNCPGVAGKQEVKGAREITRLRRKVKKFRRRVRELEPYEPRTAGLSVNEDGAPVIDVHFPESFARLMLQNFRWYLDEHDAPNYVAMPMTDMTTGEVYECFIGRPGGKSPHELRRIAEARVAQLEAELAGLRAGKGHEGEGSAHT